MPYSRCVDNDGILITTISGSVTLKELIELQNDIPNYFQNDEIYELVIHQNDTEMVQDSKESEISADNVRRVMQKYKRGAIAFVASGDFIFGILRQLQMRTENELIQMAVFRNEETALKWILELRSSNQNHNPT